MIMRSMIVVVSAISLLLFSASRVNAQIVSITATNFVPATPSANPQGTASVPAGTWKVIWDYGTVTNGTYTPNNKIGVGGASPNFTGPGNAVWGGGAMQVENLNAPLPPNTTVRARLQKQNADGSWSDAATAYSPLPIPANKCTPCMPCMPPCGPSSEGPSTSG